MKVFWGCRPQLSSGSIHGSPGCFTHRIFKLLGQKITSLTLITNLTENVAITQVFSISVFYALTPLPAHTPPIAKGLNFSHPSSIWKCRVLPISEAEAVTERSRKHILLIATLCACRATTLGEIVYPIPNTVLGKAKATYGLVFSKISL